MTAAQFARWQRYYAAEPWGFPAANTLNAIGAATVANFAPFREGDVISPARFLWRPDAKPEKATGSAVQQMGEGSKRLAHTVDLRKPLPR